MNAKATYNHEFTYNYNGFTYTAVGKGYRRDWSRGGEYVIETTAGHTVRCTENGWGVASNGYSTAIVTCKPTPETRAAQDTIVSAMRAQGFPENEIASFEATYPHG